MRARHTRNNRNRSWFLCSCAFVLTISIVILSMTLYFGPAPASKRGNTVNPGDPDMTVQLVSGSPRNTMPADVNDPIQLPPMKAPSAAELLLKLMPWYDPAAQRTVDEGLEEFVTHSEKEALLLEHPDTDIPFNQTWSATPIRRIVLVFVYMDEEVKPIIPHYNGTIPHDILLVLSPDFHPSRYPLNFITGHPNPRARVIRHSTYFYARALDEAGSYIHNDTSHIFVANMSVVADEEVFDPQFIEKLQDSVTHHAQDGAGIWSCTIHSTDGTIESAGIEVLRKWGRPPTLSFSHRFQGAFSHNFDLHSDDPHVPNPECFFGLTSIFRSIGDFSRTIRVTNLGDTQEGTRPDYNPNYISKVVDLDHKLLDLERLVLSLTVDHIRLMGKARAKRVLLDARYWLKRGIVVYNQLQEKSLHRSRNNEAKLPMVRPALGHPLNTLDKVKRAVSAVRLATVRANHAGLWRRMQIRPWEVNAEITMDVALRLFAVTPARLLHGLDVMQREKGLVPALHTPIVPQRVNKLLENAPVTIAWYLMCCYCCGFSNEIIHYLLALRHYHPVMLMSRAECFCSGFPQYVFDVIDAISNEDESYIAHEKPVLWISHTPPQHYEQTAFKQRPPDYHVGRSMYEFSNIPRLWHNYTHIVDEIWVPSQFALDAFIRSGSISPDKLFVIPESLDVNLYSPELSLRYDLPTVNFKAGEFGLNDTIASNVSPKKRSVLAKLKKNYKFLSVFKWEDRKGWDILLCAYFSQFSSDDQVSLYIVTFIFGTRETDWSAKRDALTIKRWILKFAETNCSVYPNDLPHFVVIATSLGEDEVAAMYRSVDAFVLPTRGEGWGLPAIQAMSSALPTISTNYSGNVDFMLPELSYLIPVCKMSKVPRDSPGLLHLDDGIEWAEPCTKETGQLMRQVYEQPKKAREIGKAARKHIVEHYSEEAVYWSHLRPRIDAITEIIRKRRLDANSVGSSHLDNLQGSVERVESEDAGN